MILYLYAVLSAMEMMICLFSCKYMTSFRSAGKSSPYGQAGQLPSGIKTAVIDRVKSSNFIS